MPVLKVYKDGVWEEVAGVSGHAHSVSDIVDFPSSMPANGGNADTVDGKHAEEFADVGHNHDDKYAAISHGTHVTYTTTTPKMNGTASVGTNSTVSRSDHIHPTDTTRASASDLNNLKALVGNTSVSSQISNAVAGLQQKHQTTTATLYSSNWYSNSQTVTVSGVTSSNTVITVAHPSYHDGYNENGVICTAQGTDTLTFTCKEVPTSDLIVNIIIFN